MRISRHLFREILVFAGVLLALVLVLAWWSLGRALDEQAWARADEAAQRLTLELDREMQGVSRFGSTLQAWWLAGEYDLAAPERLDGLALPILERQTFVSSVNFCRADGTSVLLLRTGDRWHSRWLVPGPGERRLRWTRRDADGGARVGPWEPTAYDPRTRDWYALVSQSAEPRWSPSAYRFMTTKDPGLTISFPVRDGDRLAGVVALDVLLDDLTGKAWEAQPTPGTLVAIADEHGRALILPRRAPFEEREARFQAFLEPVGPGLLPELTELVSGLAFLPPEGRRDRTSAGGRSYYGLVKPYRGPSGLTWYLVVAIPEVEIMAESRAKGLAVLAFALLGFAILSWRAWSIAQRFGRPLDTLARSSGPLAEAPASGSAEGGGEQVWEAVALQDALRLADRAVEEKIALREQLRSSQRRETIGTLASGVAHDVNNQLTVALGQLDPTIEELGAGHPLAGELALAREALLRCAETTKALLSYSRAGGTSAAKVVDLNRMLRGVAVLLGRVLGGRITLVLDLAPDLPRVAGVRVQLEQVVVNLVINARDAMPEGGTLTLRTAIAADGMARLSVSDTGVGMSAEVKPHIFEPYFTTKAEGLGTGLGLAMVYGIVRSHGGRIEVESAPGLGTTFVVDLPSTSAKVVPDVTPVHGLPAVGLRGQRFLVADDEPALRKVLEDVLSRAGAMVTVAADGAEASEIWRAQGPFDGVVSDLRMPRATGLDLYRVVRAGSREVPFLLVSGLGLEEAAPVLATDPRAGTLAKPYEGADLLRAVGRLVG